MAHSESPYDNRLADGFDRCSSGVDDALDVELVLGNHSIDGWVGDSQRTRNVRAPAPESSDQKYQVIPFQLCQGWNLGRFVLARSCGP